jgi:hypothetical protein
MGVRGLGALEDVPSKTVQVRDRLHADGSGIGWIGHLGDPRVEVVLEFRGEGLWKMDQPVDMQNAVAMLPCAEIGKRAKDQALAALVVPPGPGLYADTREVALRG